MSPNLPISFQPAKPGLKDALNQFRKELFLDLNCHHIGTIQTFDPVKQTATLTINYKKTYYRLENELYTPVLVDYPLIIDSPVVTLGGDQAALTMPIAPGDECLVLFNDRDMDNWFSGGSGTGNNTPRAHAYADAIVIVGLRSSGKVIRNYDGVRAVLRNGDALVGVGTTLVKIANASFTLNQLLQELTTELQSLTSAIAAIQVGPGSFANGGGSVAGTSGVPLNASTINGIGTQIAATANKIAQLLE